MSRPHRVQACRLCLAMDTKLLEIEMGLKNSVKSMLGENVYYTSGLPSYVCFECAAQLRKYTKFRRKCRRVQTFLYGILKNNGEVTEEELNKIDRHKLGLESSLSVRTVALESIGQPTEVKEEVIDDLGLTMEDDIDIKIEESRFDDTYDDEERDETSALTDVNNIQTGRSWEQGNQEDEFLEYMATLGTGPYLKERTSQNQEMTDNFRNTTNHYNSVSNEIGNCTIPNIKLPLSTTITPISPTQFIVCKKCLGVFKCTIFSEHERLCAQDVNGETVSVLPDQNLDIKRARMTQRNVMSQVQVNGQVKNVVNLTVFARNGLDTTKDKQPLGSNVTIKNKRLASKKKNLNGTTGMKMKNNDYANALMQDKGYMIREFALNKNSHASNLNNTQNEEKHKDKSNANNAKIDVNEYMEAIELLPHDKHKKMQNFNASNKNKTKNKLVNGMEGVNSTTVRNHQTDEHIIVPKQEKSDFTISKIVSAYNMNNIENDKDVEDSDGNNLLVDRNIANKNIKTKKDDASHIITKSSRVVKKASYVEYETKRMNQDIKTNASNVKTENKTGKTKGRKAKKKRKRLNTDDNGDFKQRKKVVHRRWSKEEMEIVTRRFSHELSLKQNPGVAKCKLVLEEEPLLSGRTWMQLNSCVNNIYMKKIKSQRRIAQLQQGRPVPFHSHLSLPTQVLEMRRFSSGESLN